MTTKWEAIAFIVMCLCATAVIITALLTCGNW